MGKTYNGRFDSPPEPKGGGKWIVLGCLLIPTWSFAGLGLIGSICCFVKGGRMNAERRMHQRFHEFCAVIGMRQRVPFKDLMKASGMNKTDLRKYLLKMISKGYFGEGTHLDVNRDELILPPAQNHTEYRGSWLNMVVDLLHSLKGGNIIREPVQQPRQSEAPRQEPQPEPQEAPKPPRSKDIKKTYMDELERTLAELYQLNEQIRDEGVSQRIDRIGTLTAGIFRVVIEKPDREQDVRKFMNYYLPTTLKLLKSYDMLEEQSYQGENIIASRKKIESVLDMLIEAYEKQLDRLFHNDALDIATDIDVLETMMAGDGLAAKCQLKL